MKIILAPDKFRGSLTAAQACQSMEEGIRAVYPDAEVVSIPMSDGGEGFLEAMIQATQGTYQAVDTYDPLMRPIRGRWGRSGDGHTAFIEMATVSGLALLAPEEQHTVRMTTYGTGVLMKAAIEAGMKQLVLGIGGSATTDGGIGMAQALGWEFLDTDGQSLKPVGQSLADIRTIRPPEKDLCEGIRITVASDVTAPLYGPEGAAFVYGPQKGATPEEIEFLDRGLKQLAARYGELKPGTDSFAEIPGAAAPGAETPGAGAAGGLGYGLMAFCHAELQPGATVVMELTGYHSLLKRVDLILTGEGKLDEQSLQGKLIGRICETAGSIPVIAFCGTLAVEPATLKRLGLSFATSILTGPVDLDTALETAYNQLKDTVSRVMGLIQKYENTNH